MLVPNFKSTGNTGRRNDETQATLKTAFTEVLQRCCYGSGEGRRKIAPGGSLQRGRQDEGHAISPVSNGWPGWPLIGFST